MLSRMTRVRQTREDTGDADQDSEHEDFEDDDAEPVVDLGMFAGMFKTAMVMLEDTGKLK
jgi:hypothetical protein